MHIGLDLDGVLADLVGETIKLFNKTWPENWVNYEDLDGWDYLKRERGLSAKVQSELFYQVWKGFENLPTAEKVGDIRECICKLQEKAHIISIITHRDKRTYSYVPRWLNQKQILYDNLIFMSSKTSLEKHDFVDVLVDDHPRTVEIAENYPNTFVLLRDQPWNRSTVITSSLPNTSRIVSLKDLPGYISNIQEYRSSIHVA